MTTTPTFTSRIVISKEKLETWKAPQTRQRHLSEDPARWYNTATSCHICGKYTDRSIEREEHYRTQHDGALFPEEYNGWSYGEWACHVCGKGFDSKEPRDVHYKRYHPKVTIKWPDGQPADAWHVRPHYIQAERRPFRNLVVDIGQSGGSGEVIDVRDLDDEEEPDIIVHEGPPPSSQNQKRPPPGTVEIDELDSVVSAAPQLTKAKTLGPAARILAELHKIDWSQPSTQPHFAQPPQATVTSPISKWALEVRKEMEEPIELPDPVVPPKRTPPVSPQQASSQGQVVASPNKTPNGSIRPEKSVQRSTFHGRFQRALYNAGLQFNKISESMTMKEPADVSSAPDSPMQSKELDAISLRPLFAAGDLRAMNDELDSVISRINIAVKTLKSDHHILTTRERVFATKKDAMNRSAAKHRDEYAKKMAQLDEMEKQLKEKLNDHEEAYAERCALLDVRENDLEDRENDLEIKLYAYTDKVDEMAEMECDEGFEDAVEQMMEA